MGAADAAIRSPGAVSHGNDEVDTEIYERSGKLKKAFTSWLSPHATRGLGGLAAADSGTEGIDHSLT